jgi:hypothetical protein
MSEKGDIDDQWAGWLDSMTRCGMVAMRREEFREHMDQLQTEAYADGRADERAEWAPVLDALEEALEFIEDYADVVDGSYGEPRPNRAMQLLEPIREAIAKAKP